MALLVGVIALVRFYSKKNNTILFIATGFLGTGLLDGYHAIVTSSYFDQLFPSAPPSLIPWSWNASRTFLSLMMLFSVVAWRREKRIGEAGKIKEGTIYVAAGILTLFSFIFFAFVPLPRAHFPEIIFHRPQEFVSALFFLLALVGFLKKAHWKTDTFEHWLILSLVVGLMAQVMYMSFSGQVFEVMFDSAHELKVVSYVCVLTGLITSMYEIFQQVEESGSRIESANAELKKEIAERKQAEFTLRTQSGKLKRSNEDLEQFAYVASHDLKEPLRMVASYVQLLARRYKGKLDADADEFIEFAVDGASRMKRLIDDLLDYSRVTTQGKRLEKTCRNDALAQALANLGSKLESSGAIVNSGSLPITMGDESQLVRLFQNLIDNAIKFCIGRVPEIYISASPIDDLNCSPLTTVQETSLSNLDGPQPDLNPHSTNSAEKLPGWLISVSDNGIGIDPKYFIRIFQIFQRLHRKEDLPGTGIGLSICQKTVRRHGGRIWVESKLGEGATFKFTLPLATSDLSGEAEEEGDPLLQMAEAV